MGRRATHPDSIPHLRARRKGRKVFYYYDHGGKPRHEEPLGCDRGIAIRRWAEIEGLHDAPPHATVMFRWVGEQYLREKTVQKAKAPRTLDDNRKEFTKLCEFFDDPPAPLNAIKPLHVRQFLDWRGRTAKVRANREKALLSAIWNFARSKGYTEQTNPCAGIKGFKETGRDVYIEDEQYFAIRDQGDETLQDAMDLAYLLGQRPSDVMELDLTQLRDGAVNIQQHKTGAKIRVEIVGELATVLKRITKRKASYKVCTTRLIVNQYGRPIGVHALSLRFAKARTAAGVPSVQFRDLRAKAATDKAETTGNVREAQKLLGHAGIRMTEHYVRNRRGALVQPTR